MSRLTDLLRQVRTTDAQLAKDLEAEIGELTNRRTFGLVFEPHQPEAVELPSRPIRRGDKVRILQPRGETKAGDTRLWRVRRIERNNGDHLAHLTEIGADEPEQKSVVTEDLVVVAEFKDRIYPGLVETGRVEYGEDKPFHTVINAENYHALEMLTYTHRQSLDAIYIDPPYNTGAKDWKYNNDYVESDDDYRHSKWLAFMERRLKIARELLNPDDSVLIVTIDEKEYLRLGMLLEQLFPEASLQMVSVAISSAGVSRSAFSRTDEYYFFITFGSAVPKALPLGPEWSGDNVKRQTTVRWESLLRSGNNGRRIDRPNLFYPVHIDSETGRLRGFGDSLPLDMATESYRPPEGTIAVFPYARSGEEACWRISSSKAQELVELGAFRVGTFDGQRATFSYLKQGELEKVRQGIYKLEGYDDAGVMILDTSHYVPTYLPPTQWNVKSHNAGAYGSSLVKGMLPSRDFPFPKSLYAVEDALRFFVSEKRNAKILDFFSGSGTTAHAVMRLNKQDGGQRQCISVTNNEVSANEQRKLLKEGLRPGDSEWERLGICDYITKPRLTAAITGHTPEGKPIKGKYRFTDEFPMADGFEENAAYFTLTYEAPLSVRHNRAFSRVAPMLWLRAGSRGRIVTDLGERGWDMTDSYAVLEDFDRADDFMQAVRASEQDLTVYIITDDQSAFQMACRALPEQHTPVRLYESYLQNFEINTGGNR